MPMKEIKFVDIGEGITEGHLQKWLVRNGDSVKEDQSLAQIETDKAVVNVPSPISGMVKVVAKEGSTVRVGDTLAYVGTAEELEGRSAATGKAPVEEVVQPVAAVAAPKQHPITDVDEKEILATPAVRKLARELNIDISTVAGTGPNGRIIEADLRQAGTKAAPTGKEAAAFSPVPKRASQDLTERVPMSQTRKAIAKNMELSWTIPRAAHMDKLDATHLFEIVSKEKPKMEKLGVKLTFMPFIIKATVAALRDNPRFNSSYDKERQEVVLKKYYNIGLAAEAPDGLKVIVVKSADKKSIAEIARDISALSAKLKDMTISIEEMRDSTFTITNIGSLGGGYFSVPMINYPEVGILGVHRIRDEAIVSGGEIRVGKVLPFSIVFDHRVVDGAEAVHLGNAIISYLEDPEFLEMLG